MRWIGFVLGVLGCSCGGTGNGDGGGASGGVPGTGGAAPDGTLATGGSGAGATASTGAGGGTAQSDGNSVLGEAEVCHCRPFHACQGGQCVRGNYLITSLRRRTEGQETLWCAFGPTHSQGELIAEIGQCEVVGSARVDALLSPPGAGTLTVAGPSFEAVSQAETQANCYPQLPLLDYAPGETLTLSGSGGPVFPAFEAHVVAPEVLADVVFPDEIVAGEPLTVTWSPGSAKEINLLVTGDPLIMCHDLPDSGSATLSAEVTAYVNPSTEVGLRLYRTSAIHFTPAGSSVGIDVQVESNASADAVLVR